MHLPPKLAAIAAAQGGPFTAAQARAAGFDDREVSRLVRSGQWARLRRGVYVESVLVPATEEARHALDVRAALLRVTGLVAASHLSSAVLQGISLLGSDYSLVHLTHDSAGSARTEAGVQHHVAPLPSSQLTKTEGLLVTSAARTVFDLARTTTYEAGLVAIESALHQGLVEPEELRELVAYCADWPGAREAARAVAVASPYSESPGETLSRIAFDYLGLPQPAQQVALFDEAGFIARVDFWWEEFHTVGEFDGRMKYVGAGVPDDTLFKEKRREDRVRDGGAEFFRFGWMEAWRKSPSIRRKALASFERGSRPGARCTLRAVLPSPRKG